MRVGMGLVGPGFVGAHHIDAVRRLGFVDVVAVAASTGASAREKAAALFVDRACDSYEALIDDPDVHVVHVTTPNHLHERVIARAIAAGKHVVSDKPLAPTAAAARRLWDAAERAGVVHAVTFNYRGHPLVQQARAMVAARELGSVHHVHGAYLQDWLLTPADYSWRLDPAQGGESSAVGDIGSHWCDLAEHVTGLRIEAVLAELTTVVPRRLKPPAASRAFETSASDRREPVTITSEDLATILLRFSGGATGSLTVGQVCAGHKNDFWLEVSGADASAKWEQERAHELWIGRRGLPNSVLGQDAAVLHPDARAYVRLPAGHHQGWADAFANVMRDIYGVISSEADRASARPPACATFADGYRSACVVEAILESHRRGGVWTTVQAAEMVGGSR